MSGMHISSSHVMLRSFAPATEPWACKLSHQQAQDQPGQSVVDKLDFLNVPRFIHSGVSGFSGNTPI